jgi:hypothetical protein
MKTKDNIKKKRIYNSPALELIKLDNEIALTLESIPPDGPGESLSLAPEYFNNYPFKSNIG